MDMSNEGTILILMVLLFSVGHIIYVIYCNLNDYLCSYQKQQHYKTITIFSSITANIPFPLCPLV